MRSMSMAKINIKPILSQNCFSTLEWMITCNTLSHLQEFFQLHAGAVIKGGKIILLPANHGQGKTTLTLSLAQNNYRCLSDDIVLIEPETTKMIPFPRSFLIKDKSIKSMSESHLIDKKSGYYCKSENILYYNPYPTNRSPFRNARPHTIIELKHSLRFKNELRPVSKSQMCIKLLRQSFNIHNYKRNGVSILTKLVRNSRCYSLKTNNVNRCCSPGISNMNKPTIKRHITKLLNLKRGEEGVDEIWNKLESTGWDDIINIAQEQRVITFLFHKIKHLGLEEKLKPETLRIMSLKYQDGVARNVITRHVLKDIIRSFNQYGIKAVILKGAINFL